MEFRILGPVEVVGTGRPIRLGSRRERAVLAALVLGGGDVVSADRLVDALWGDEPPRSAAKSLQNYVLKLRKALGPATIETQAPGYRLAVETAVIDTRRFDALLRDAGRARAEGRPGDAAPFVREALGLWRGAPLEELDGWDVARAEATRLNELRRVAVEELVDAELACGNAAPMVAELEAMVAAEPLRERRWSMLMLALYRCGRQADALRAFQRARTMLADELGIEPGPELRTMERAIADQDPSLDLVAPSNKGHGPRTEAPADERDALPPYQGLAAFEPEDHARFFGRSALVGELVARAERSRFVAVVGASGSGKSSVVRAGVLAMLRGGALPGSETWPSLVMTPGSRPLSELASALSPIAGRSTSELQDLLETNPARFTTLAREVVGPTGRLVIVIDQFEELFTQTRDGDERRRFVAVVTSAAADSDGPATVVLALRADFYGHCSAYPELAALLDAGSTLLCPMEPDEIRAAINGPAELAGLAVEPGLTELVVRDVGDEPGALPLLSHALLETWKRRNHRTLTVDSYREAGGAHGAIAQTAESVYRRLDPGQQGRARQIFLRLTELGDGTEDTSRRVARDELKSDAATPDLVLQVLADARLITVDQHSVQVAHEALIRGWPRLRSWLDEDRDGRRIHRHLTHAARDWAALGREASELYRGPRLATTREWLARDGHAAELNPLEAEFVRAGIERENAERAAEVERSRARDRSNRRLRQLLASSAVVLVVALIAGTLAFVQRGRADDEARSARSASGAATAGRLVAESKSLQSENRYLGTLLALEAERIRRDPQTRGAVFGALLEEPRRVLTLPTPNSDEVIPLADETALVLSDGHLERWDLRTGARRNRYPGAPVTAITAAPAGTVVVGRDDGTIAWVDPSGRPVGARISVARRARADWRGQLPFRRGGVGFGPSDLAVSPDGSRLAVSFGLGGDSRIVDGADWVSVYDLKTGRELDTRFGGNTGTVTTVAFDHDGRRLLTGGNDSRIIVHDAATGATLGVPLVLDGNVWTASFDPTRNRIAASSLASGVNLFDLDSGSRTALGTGSEAEVSWSPDGATVAVGGNGPVQLYDATTLAPRGAPIDAQTGRSIPRFTANGQLLVGGHGGPATLWDPAGQSVLARRVPDASNYVFPMAGGRVVAAPDFADSVALYDERTMHLLGRLSPGPGPETPLAFPATFAASYYRGDRIAVMNRAGTMQMYAVPSRRPMGAPYQLGFPGLYAVFSRDLHQIAVGGRGGEIALIDLRTRKVRRLASPLNNYIDGLAFSPHGELVAGDAGHAVLFRHIERAKPVVRDISRFTRGTDGPAGLDLSPDGHTLAIAARGLVSFVDIRTEQQIGAPVRVSPNQIVWYAFSLDGRTIVTDDNANDSRLVDVETHELVGPAMPTAPATGPVFSGDSKLLGTSTPNGGGELLAVDPAVWGREACRLAGRNLTDAEWAKYLAGQGPRRRTCPQYP